MESWKMPATWGAVGFGVTAHAPVRAMNERVGEHRLKGAQRQIRRRGGESPVGAKARADWLYAASVFRHFLFLGAICIERGFCDAPEAVGRVAHDFENLGVVEVPPGFARDAGIRVAQDATGQKTRLDKHA